VTEKSRYVRTADASGRYGNLNLTV